MHELFSDILRPGDSSINILQLQFIMDPEARDRSIRNFVNERTDILPVKRPLPEGPDGWRGTLLVGLSLFALFILFCGGVVGVIYCLYYVFSNVWEIVQSWWPHTQYPTLPPWWVYMAPPHALWEGHFTFTFKTTHKTKKVEIISRKESKIS